MPRRKCVVKFVDSFGIENAAKVEAESLFEAANCRLQRLDSSFWTEEGVFDRMCITVEVHEEPTIHTVMIEKLKRWIKLNYTAGTHGRRRKRRNGGGCYLGPSAERVCTSTATFNSLDLSRFGFSAAAGRPHPRREARLRAVGISGLASIRRRRNASRRSGTGSAL